MSANLRRAARLAALSVSCTMAAACDKAPPPPPPAPPQETWLVVTSPAAPLFRKLQTDGSPHELIYPGELVKLASEVKQMHWAGKLDGQKAERDGMLIEVKIVDNGGLRYGFRPDFGAETSVPATAWLCEALAGQGTFDLTRCSDELRRARTADGSLAVYIPCITGRCPVGLLREGKMSVVSVENLASARFFTGKKRSVLLATVRWSKDEGKQSGGALVPVLLDAPAPTLAAEIPLDRIDSRDLSRITDRLVQAKITPTEVALTGEETTRSADGNTLSTKPIDEKHPLPPLD